MNTAQQIIKYLLKHPPHQESDILTAKRKFCKLADNADTPTNAELLAEYKKLKLNQPHLLNLLRKRQVRTLSGVAPIAVLTQPYPCPGKCAYCPNEAQMPKSYLSNEPAVMRAILCNFNPYQQVQLRLRALTNNGHTTDKIELIVMGGTWSFLPENYRLWYIKECFRAANDFPKNIKTRKHKSIKTLKAELKKEQKRNEKAKNRIVGLTLETRPDYINEQELWQMRQLGCTRIEIGVQHIDDKILTLNQRGHGVEETIQATQLMRQFGFKITYHLMLNLPGSTPAKDFKMFQTIYNDSRFQPDQVKIYPTVVAKDALIYQWHQQGKWQPYSTQQLTNLIIKIKSITPPWMRIIRVIRDIPEESIIAGNKITNLRQIIKTKMAQQNISCQCIRCREVGHQIKFSILNFKFSNKAQLPSPKLITRRYKVLNGTEYFLSFESKDKSSTFLQNSTHQNLTNNIARLNKKSMQHSKKVLDKKILYAFCRLYLPNLSPPFQGRVAERSEDGTVKTAFIRELHTYGQIVPVGHSGHIQHSGLGKQLLTQAEKIARQKKYTHLKIISGIGVRQYYRKLDYHLSHTYMVKRLNKEKLSL